ncbi:hypothetical protein HMPREF0973_00096 [Prevotella veroralis F0319]|uniref:Uncharacterized protein n=1 Tax=Prevotella veroralis F0319 TaxID=649761 RepID=C9MKI8_9BACT|nr:hypothetical protein HMPREF0973_00096 [Prevotella veroralis F0319]
MCGYFDTPSVDSIIYKQRGRFFDVKRRPFHCKETPSSNGEGRSFN